MPLIDRDAQRIIDLSKIEELEVATKEQEREELTKRKGGEYVQ